MPQSIFAIHDEDSEGPFGDLMNDGKAQSLPDRYDGWPKYIHENEKWDVVCAKQKLDDWVSEEVSNKDRNILIVRGIGFLLFIIGFDVQLL